MRHWETVDDYDIPVFTFTPCRPAGLQLPDNFQPSESIDFFSLFFSDDVLEKIVEFTNVYAWGKIDEKHSYAQQDGSWQETTKEEISKLIGVFIYFGLVPVPDCMNYWSTQSLYHGLWARAFFTRLRFKALLSFVHCAMPGVGAGDRLWKVRYLYDIIREKCIRFWQPRQTVSIDERMLSFKGRSAMKVYIKDKPTKWGLTLYRFRYLYSKNRPSLFMP